MKIPGRTIALTILLVAIALLTYQATRLAFALAPAVGRGAPLQEAQIIKPPDGTEFTVIDSQRIHARLLLSPTTGQPTTIQEGNRVLQLRIESTTPVTTLLETVSMSLHRDPEHTDLTLSPSPQPRYAPTNTFAGRTVSWQTQLLSQSVVVDVAIAALSGALPTNGVRAESWVVRLFNLPLSTTVTITPSNGVIREVEADPMVVVTQTTHLLTQPSLVTLSGYGVRNRYPPSSAGCDEIEMQWQAQAGSPAITTTTKSIFIGSKRVCLTTGTLQFEADAANGAYSYSLLGQVGEFSNQAQSVVEMALPPTPNPTPTPLPEIPTPEMIFEVPEGFMPVIDERLGYKLALPASWSDFDLRSAQFETLANTFGLGEQLDPLMDFLDSPQGEGFGVLKVTDLMAAMFGGLPTFLNVSVMEFPGVTVSSFDAWLTEEFNDNEMMRNVLTTLEDVTIETSRASYTGTGDLTSLGMNASIFFKIVAFINNDKVYMVTLLTQETQRATREEDFDQIIATFQPTASASPTPTTRPPAVPTVMPTNTPFPTEEPVALDHLFLPPIDAQSPLGRALAGDYEGTVVTIFGPFTDEDADIFNDSIADFEEATGIDIQYEGSNEFETTISVRVDAGDPPDIADFPQPGLLANFASGGSVIDVSTFLDMDHLTANYNQSWLDMATMEGPNRAIMAGVWHRFNTKSLVWYAKDDGLDQIGFAPPQTWWELWALSDALVELGETPWCLGIESGAATGWPATDWIEDIMLRTTSLENYDAWTRGELPFTSDEVTTAVKFFTEIWLNPEYVEGGAAAIVSTSFNDSVAPMFTDPPGCYFHRQGDFITSFFPPDAQAGVDYDFFYLPPIDEAYGSPFLVNGDIFAMFNDRPEVRAVMEFFTYGASVRGWVKAGGVLSPHKDTSLDWYGPDLEREIARLAQEATSFRFDASDQMPAEVGAGAFWSVMTDYVAGDVDMYTALEKIDGAWPR